MNKFFKNIFVALLIVPLFWFCFTGCSNDTQKEKIMLTTENINEYLVVNYTLSTLGGTSAQDVIVTVETSKRINNIEFFDCEIEISSKKGTDVNYKYSSNVDYEGKSSHSYIQKSMYNFGAQLTIEISFVSGYILYNK